MGLLKAGLGAAGGVMATSGRNLSTANRCLPTSWPARAANVPVAAAPTRAARTTSSPTARSSPSTTDKACSWCKTARSSKSRWSPVSSSSIPAASRASLAATWAIPSRRPSPISAAALPLAATRARTSASTSSTPRRSSTTSTAPPRPCPSAWSITTLAWTSTSPCAATASIRTASPTRCCSTPTCAAT